MDWDKVRVFHAVAEAGSFTRAGEVLNLSQSAVSRQVSTLEEELGVVLFHRHARGLLLTEQGENLYRTAHDVYHKLAMTEARLTDNKERPQGPLKITTTIGFGSVWLTPRIKEFLDIYPDIAVTILVANSEVDLSMREADVAIRLSPPRQPDLIQRHLVTMHYRCYATAEYLKERGMPQNPEDLDHHRIITFGEGLRDWAAPSAAFNWLTEAGATPGRTRKPILQVNNIYAMYRAVQSGLGLAALPEYLTQGSPNLVQVLPQLTGPRIEVFFVYPEELRHSARIAAFRDFLVRKVGELEPARGAA